MDFIIAVITLGGILIFIIFFLFKIYAYLKDRF